MKRRKWDEDDVYDGPSDIEWGGLTGSEAGQAYDNCN